MFFQTTRLINPTCVYLHINCISYNQLILINIIILIGLYGFLSSWMMITWSEPSVRLKQPFKNNLDMLWYGALKLHQDYAHFMFRILHLDLKCLLNVMEGWDMSSLNLSLDLFNYFLFCNFLIEIELVAT
jgi:hypothetical protein